MTRLAYAALAIAGFAACSDDGVDPITKIEGPRVLAITTEPSALVVDGELALDLFAVDADGPRGEPGGERPVDAVRMRACAPWQFVVDPARDCAGDTAMALERDEAGRFTMSAPALAAAFPAPPGVMAPPDPWRAALAAGLTLRVPIIAEVDVAGETLVAKRDVGVVDGEAVRRNPRIIDVRFDGATSDTLRAQQRYALTVRIDRESLDAPIDPQATTEIEGVTCHLFATSGEVGAPEAELELSDAPELETAASTFTAGAAGSAWVFVVAIDETGGMSTAAVPLTIAP